MLKILENGIIKVFDKFGNEIPFNKKEVKLYKSPHSSAGRESAAIEYCKKHNLTYHLLFPNDINPFFNNIQRDSLNITEK